MSFRNLKRLGQAGLAETQDTSHPPLAEIRSRCQLHQAFGAIELGLSIISTSRSSMSIANMAPACQESGLTQGLSIHASSSVPSLVPLFAFPSSSFPSPDPSWCFYFFLFFSSSIKRGPPLNMVATRAEFKKTSYCCLFCCFFFYSWFL